MDAEEVIVNLQTQLNACRQQESQLLELLSLAPDNDDVATLQGQLAAAIQGLEQQLLTVKKEQLLRSLEDDYGNPGPQDEGSDSDHDSLLPFQTGELCRAPRVFDRRYADARVEQVLAEGQRIISWVHPRAKGELMCHYWEEGNCKKTAKDCLFSHGLEMHVSELRPQPSADGVGRGFSPPSEISKGAVVLARYHDHVWYEATVEEALGGQGSSDNTLMLRFKGYEDVEAVQAVPERVITMGRYLGRGDDESSSSDDSSDSEIEDAWAGAKPYDAEDGAYFEERTMGGSQLFAGAGPRRSSLEATSGGRPGGAANGGLFEDAYVVGEWEQHTRGIGSRLLAKMGYRRGEGLGLEKQGIARPIAIRVLPPGRSLDYLHRPDPLTPGGGKGAPPPQGRGRKRKRPDQEGAGAKTPPRPDVFAFLNARVHSHHSSSTGRGGNPFLQNPTGRDHHSGGAAGPGVGAPPKGGGSSGGKGGKNVAHKMSKEELRNHLASANDTERGLEAKIRKLEETVARNEGSDRAVAAAASRQLTAAKGKLQQVRTSGATAHQALRDKRDRKLAKKGCF